jgi:hypothetical protein
MIRKLCLAAVAAIVCTAPASAQAQWPYWGYGGFGGGPWGYGYTYNYGVGYIPAPPYYSVFPPVYYSPHITARPYGASPYAWPAGFSPIVVRDRYEVAPPAAPLLVENPFVKGAALPTSAKSPESAAIANPYFTQR